MGLKRSHTFVTWISSGGVYKESLFRLFYFFPFSLSFLPHLSLSLSSLYLTSCRPPQTWTPPHKPPSLSSSRLKFNRELQTFNPIFPEPSNQPRNFNLTPILIWTLRFFWWTLTLIVRNPNPKKMNIHILPSLNPNFFPYITFPHPDPHQTLVDPNLFRFPQPWCGSKPLLLFLWICMSWLLLFLPLTPSFFFLLVWGLSGFE